MKPVIVFDMHETLLDLSALDPVFARIFSHSDGAQLRTTWFRQVLELFMTATITGAYRSFDKLSDDALQMLKAQWGSEASADDRAALRSAQARMPAHADVRPGLTRLKQAGFRLATLSNSTRVASEALLQSAGIRDQLDAVLSADDVQRFKPAREAYEYAARSLAVTPGDVMLVAAHGWDIAGAMAAGWLMPSCRRSPDPDGPADPPSVHGPAREFSSAPASSTTTAGARMQPHRRIPGRHSPLHRFLWPLSVELSGPWPSANRLASR